MNPFAISVADILSTYSSHPSTGLSTSKAHTLLEEQGENTLPKGNRQDGPIRIFLRQWKSPLILILVIAAAISGYMGEMVDMWIILATAIINAAIGFFQEYKANRALEKLNSLVTFSTTVIRNGEKRLIPIEQVVVGDIVLLSSGSKVPADGRLIEANELAINEAALTGESYAVQKQTKKIKADASIGDQTNMAFRGTVVEKGDGVMIVTAIGKDTQIGTIARLVHEATDELTPLQKQLNHLGKIIGIIVLALVGLIMIVGTWRANDSHEYLEVFETAVAVAVAAIPEGLVISLTIILAVGMQFIVKRKALVRKLVAAETLGSVSVICTDKTGTLTKGEMSVSSWFIHDNNETVTDVSDARMKRALQIGYLANDAYERPDEPGVFVGDSTDVALKKAGDLIDATSATIIDTIAFSSARKYMASLVKEKDKQYVLVKGAPDVLLEHCTYIAGKTKALSLQTKQKQAIQTQLEAYTEQGYRLLAVAQKTSTNDTLDESDISELCLYGIFVIVDPLRDDIADTIARTKEAGIHTVMITGDHANTAFSIAKEIGIAQSLEQVMTGSQLDELSDVQLNEAIERIRVFARVAPEHKIRIVKAFQANDEVVAMTGDGVNDAPALKGADIGIAVGSGTDVAKETADMVLLNDDFKTIVAAVEEGRTIYQNIKKVVLYLFSGTFAEVVLVTGTMLIGLPLPALPVQILWGNIVEDSFPNMTLAFDKGDKENMKMPPRKKSDPLIDKEMTYMIVGKSVILNIILFGIFWYYLTTTNDIALTRTIVFVGFAIDSLFAIFSMRSMRKMIWQMNPFSNLYLIGAVLFGWFMLFVAVYAPPIQQILQTVPLGIEHWVVMTCFGLASIGIIEGIKVRFLTRQRYGDRNRKLPTL